MKHAIVTGATSGIGTSITKHLSKAGWKVSMLGRNQEKLRDLEKEIPQTQGFVCDLSDPNAIKTFASEFSYHQDLLALVNNAGVYQPGAMDDDRDAVWDYHYQNNLMSAVRLTRQFWSTLKANKGSILNISSTLAVRPIANTMAYSALKSAMNNWTQALAIEGAPHQVRANCICPGIVDTPIHAFHKNDDPDQREIYQSVQGAQPLGRIGQPEDIAQWVLPFCDPGASWTTGTILNVDGGILLNS
ncbi:MAG: SDR family oxidoreductase [Pseudomonadota bacterium]